MNIAKRNAQGGFSAVELMVTLAVLGILVTVALINLRGARTDLHRQRISREFKNYLERARFDSVKRRAATNAEMATIRLNSATSFTALMDYDENGTVAPTEVRQVDFTQGTDTQIFVMDTLNYPITIRFNQRGHASAIDNLGNAINPVFRICSNCAAASPQVSYISISASGTVADTTSAPSALPTPAVTSNVNTTLNCHVLVNTNASCSQF